MKPTRRLGSRFMMTVAMALVLTLVVAAPLAAFPRSETVAFFSVVNGLRPGVDVARALSTDAYYSIVSDEPYAAFTDPKKATETHAYWSVLH